VALRLVGVACLWSHLLPQLVWGRNCVATVCSVSVLTSPWLEVHAHVWFINKTVKVVIFVYRQIFLLYWYCHVLSSEQVSSFDKFVHFIIIRYFEWIFKNNFSCKWFLRCVLKWHILYARLK
jgi:hypothetical protein